MESQYTALKQHVNKIMKDNGRPSINNFAEDFADGVRIESFYNLLFNDTNNSGLVPSKDYNQRVKNWNLLNRDLFEKDLKNRVYLDSDSIHELSTGRDEMVILKLIGVLIGFIQGTADAYATEGEENELGDIRGALVIQQPVSWTVHTEVITASDTSDDERIRGFSIEKVIQAPAKKSIVEKRFVEQEPVIEEYMSEEVVNEVRHKPRRTVTKQVKREVHVSESEESVVEEVVSRPRSRVVRKSRSPRRRRVVYEETETESEEEVIVKKRPRRRSVKREVVQHHVRRSRTPKKTFVENIEQTESESEEEIVQVRKAVVKQRVVPVEPKMQEIIVEEPQERIVKSAK